MAAAGPFLSFLLTNKWTIIFYAAVILLIYAFRKRFDWPARFVGLYRTKVGLKLMDRLGRHERFFRLFGEVAMVVGFLGMLLIVFLLLNGVYDFLFVPSAPPTVAPVIPGVTIPGLGIKVPLITGWLALFIVIIIHEFSHGVVARAHRIKVESSGLMVMGPLGGAFVEPSEKELQRSSRRTRLGIFAAGPFSNIITAFLFILVAAYLLTPLASSMVHTTGIRIVESFPGDAAAAAGIPDGARLTGIGNASVSDEQSLVAALDAHAPGDTVTVSTDAGSYPVTLGARPGNTSQAYLGIQPELLLAPNNSAWWYVASEKVLSWLSWLFLWVYILSLGIGLANLLPITITDGGRMFQEAATRLWGKERGTKVWLRVGAVTLVILLLLLVGTIVKWIVGKGL